MERFLRLRIAVPDGERLIRFADDLAVVTVVHISKLSEQAVNPVLVAVDDAWITGNGRFFSHRGRGRHAHTLGGGDLTVTLRYLTIRPFLRYLSLMLDTRLMCSAYTSRPVFGKAVKVAAAVGRLMQNVGGPSQAKRTLLMLVVGSKLLYVPPIWAVSGTRTSRNKAAIIRSQRCAVLRNTRAYRTVSTEAAIMMAGSPPGILRLLRGPRSGTERPRRRA